MNRTASQVAHILGEEVQQVKTWTWRFKDYLRPGANPDKGRTRVFSDDDVLALIHIASLWKDEPDFEAIQYDLNLGEHHNDKYLKLLYHNTPVLQEPPDDLNESWRHGMILNDGSVGLHLETARTYKQSADALLELALKSGEPLDWGYPVLYAYRHTLELYLKIVGKIGDRTHSLKRCVVLVEKQFGKRMGSPMREWIIELDKIDPTGTAFRYAGDESQTLTYAEFWVDFHQLRYAMDCTVGRLDSAALNS